MSAPLLLKYSIFFSCIQVSRFQTSRLQTSIVQSPSVQASRVQEIIAELLRHPLREKCMYSELFWSSFSYIWTKYGEILHISPHSVRMRKNTDQNNSKNRYFLRSDPEFKGPETKLSSVQSPIVPTMHPGSSFSSLSIETSSLHLEIKVTLILSLFIEFLKSFAKVLPRMRCVCSKCYLKIH